MSKNTPYIPAEPLGKLWRCLIEFDMLKPNDKIMIGLSGGKDSMLLTVMLAEIQKFSPIPFEIACFTMNGMFAPDFPIEKYQTFCNKYNVPFYTEAVDVPAAHAKKGGSPCFTCAYFRRAATNRKAKELGFNKIALAHHNDDAVETFFMNLMTTGQLKTFLPVTYLSRMDLTVLRPLLYYREEEIRQLGKEIGLEPIKNPCPYDGFTMRQYVKEHIAALNENYPEVYNHLASAMRLPEKPELWPNKLNQKEMVAKFRAFWKKGPKK